MNSMEQEDYLGSTENRLEYVVDDIINKSSSDDRMIALIEVLTETEVVPDVGRYYTFVYKPKTPRIRSKPFDCLCVYR